MPKRSTRSRRKNRLYYSENNSINADSSSNSNNSEESKSSSEEVQNDENILRNQLKSQLNELVFYKIEMPSSSSNKKIISCIEKILDIFNEIYDFYDKKKEGKINSNIKGICDDNFKRYSSNLSDYEKKENLEKNKKADRIDLKKFNTFEVIKFFIIISIKLIRLLKIAYQY